MNQEYEIPTDILLNELYVDDYIIFTNSSYNDLDVGKIVDITWKTYGQSYRAIYLKIVSLQRHKSIKIVSPSNCYKVDKEIYCQYKLKHPWQPPPFNDNNDT